MADLIKLNIDGQDIEVEPGTLIIEAARKLGIEIPTFCYDPRLKSVGACRMCLVEVERAPKLIASCATPVAPDMVVRTASERVVKARKAVLEFLLINHPLDCPTCDKGGECPLQNQTLQYGPPQSRYVEDKIRFQDDTKLKFDDVKLGPEIWMNKNRCIICFKCVRIARDLAGGEDLGIFQRGAFAKVDIPKEISYANEFSGNTVENCPVGALMSDSFRYKIRNWLLEKSESVSWLCPDGANIQVEHNQGKIYRHYSRQNDNVEEGFITDKDRYSFDITSNQDRVKIPLADDKGPLDKISYEEAVAIAVHRFKEIKGESIGLILDTTLTNEEAYYASEYFRGQFNNPTIAIASELDLDPKIETSNLGLACEMKDLEKGDLFIAIGCDIESEHPIIGIRLKKMINRGAKVYFLDSVDHRLGRFPVANIRCKAGGYKAAIDSIVDQLKAEYGEAKNIHVFVGKNLLESADLTENYGSTVKLADSLGAKLSVLTTEANYLGVKASAKPDYSLGALISKIESGQIRTLLIAAGNPVDIYPDRKRIIEAFKKLDYLIYWGAFVNSTSELAGLIIPALLPTENSGSYLNIERRLQFFKKPYESPKGIVSLIKFITDIGMTLGGELQYSAREVFGRMAVGIAEFKDLKFNYSNNYVVPSTGVPLIEGGKADSKSTAGYPYILNFGRSVYYGGSGITSKSEVLGRLTPEQVVCLNKAAADKENVVDGDMVNIVTSAGSLKLKAVVCGSLNDGELLVYGYTEEASPNTLMTGKNKPVYAKVTKD